MKKIMKPSTDETDLEYARRMDALYDALVNALNHQLSKGGYRHGDVMTVLGQIAGSVVAEAPDERTQIAMVQDMLEQVRKVVKRVLGVRQTGGDRAKRN